MPAILASWGAERPDQGLVDLLLKEAAMFHVIHKPVFVFGYKWKAEGEAPMSFDRECWHIRDDGCRAPADSRGLECCTTMMEGIMKGYGLARKAELDAIEAKAAAKAAKKAAREQAKAGAEWEARWA